MKIGILQTGQSPEELRQRHGDYDAMFRRLLDDQGFEFITYRVLDGVLPERVDDAAGWLITGSKFGVYEAHDWIAPLEQFILRVYTSSIPIVGICFGHQILAQALGGKVEKFSGGWSVGVNDYTLEGLPESVPLLAWHQDQITELPADATVVGCSSFCRYAALAYGDKAYSIQPHPEFLSDFVMDLITSRRATLPSHIAEQAVSSLTREASSKVIGESIAEFFRHRR